MPTLNLQVVASNGDASEMDDNTGFTSTSLSISFQGNTVAANRRNGGFHFPSVAIPPGANIDSATLQLYCTTSIIDDPRVEVLAEDIDDAPDFVTNADVTGRARTTALVIWDANDIGAGLETSPEIKTVIQEVIDRAGWAENNDIVIFLDSKDEAPYENGLSVRAYDGVSGQAMKLNIDFTPAGSAGRVASSRGVIRGVRRGVM